MRLSTLLESFLVDEVCFATVALILIFFRPGDVEGRLRHSYSLSLHVPVSVQGLWAVLCLMKHTTFMEKVITTAAVCQSSNIVIKISHIQI